MKIKKTYVSYTRFINVGRRAFFIELDERGVSIDEVDIAKQAVHFPYVVLTGQEPFLQRDAVAKLVTKIIKLNPTVKIEIHTNGTIRPVKIGTFENVIYYVNLKLKHSNIKYEDRIKPNIIEFFVGCNTYFIFNIKTKDDIDESAMIAQNFGVPKGQVFIKPAIENIDDVWYSEFILLVKNYGYNIGIEVEINDNNE